MKWMSRVIGLCLICATGQGEILFKDSFNTANSTDLNGTLGTRQAQGVLEKSSYTEVGTPFMIFNDWLLARGPGNVTLDRNLSPYLVGKNFEVAVKVFTPNTQNKWASMSMLTSCESNRGLSRFGFHAWDKGNSAAFVVYYGTTGQLTTTVLESELTTILGYTYDKSTSHVVKLNSTAGAGGVNTYDFIVDDHVVRDNLAYSHSDDMTRKINFTANSELTNAIYFDDLTVSGATTCLMEDESVVFCNEDLDAGNEAGKAQLLFPPSGLILKKASGSPTYVQSVDFSCSSSGLISRLPGSGIPLLNYHSVHDTTVYRFADDVGYFYAPGGDQKHNTYDVLAEYTYPAGMLESLYQGATLTKLTTARDKLWAKQPLRIAFFGDSITYGAQATDLAHEYAARATIELRKKYKYSVPTNITYITNAVGGTTSAWGATATNIVKVINDSPDLVVLAFGMNDGSQSVSSTTYKTNMESMITSLRSANPNVSIILVASFLPNPQSSIFNYSLRTAYRNKLLELYNTYTNIGFVDVGTVSDSGHMQLVKKFQDFSGNDYNHPNNFMHRVYADLVLQTLE